MIRNPPTIADFACGRACLTTDVARLFGVDRSTVVEWINAEKLRAGRLGRYYSIDGGSVIALYKSIHPAAVAAAFAPPPTATETARRARKAMAAKKSMG